MEYTAPHLIRFGLGLQNVGVDSYGWPEILYEFVKFGLTSCISAICHEERMPQITIAHLAWLLERKTNGVNQNLRPQQAWPTHTQCMDQWEKNKCPLLQITGRWGLFAT